MAVVVEARSLSPQDVQAKHALDNFEPNLDTACMTHLRFRANGRQEAALATGLVNVWRGFRCSISL